MKKTAIEELLASSLRPDSNNNKQLNMCTENEYNIP